MRSVVGRRLLGGGRFVGAVALSCVVSCSGGGRTEIPKYRPTQTDPIAEWTVVNEAGECLQLFDGNGSEVLTFRQWCDQADFPLVGNLNFALLGSGPDGDIYWWTNVPAAQLELQGGKQAFGSDAKQLLVILAEPGEEVRIAVDGREQCTVKLLENGTASGSCVGLPSGPDYPFTGPGS